MTFRLTALRRNVAANLFGRAWTMALGVLFIPVYLRFLGVEAYGLVGFFATLQGVFGLLDLGLGATINREFARLSTRPDPAPEQRAVLRTLELCYWAISVGAGCLVFLLAPAIATHWIHAARVSGATVERAVRLMGLIMVLQPPFSFYQAALMGLQRQVLVNAIVIVTGTLRSAGTAWILWRVSPTVEAFFVCQATVSLLQTALTMGAAWSGLGGVLRTRPTSANLSGVWRYAAATAANTLVGITLTQLDKVTLSRLLTLEQFGYYALAGTLASFVWVVIIPVNQALFPRFAQLVEMNDTATLRALYHRASQVMVVALVPAAATIVLFSWTVMFLWTRNAVTADHTFMVAAILISGTAINGLVSVPGYLQAASGWPALMAYTNAAAAVVLVPAILVVTPRYGAVGAACVWLVLNASYLVSNVPLMHTRLLRGELRRWYFRDLGVPIAAAIVVALAGRLLAPAVESRVLAAAWIGTVWLAALIACALFSSEVRPLLTQGRFRQPLTFRA